MVEGEEVAFWVRGVEVELDEAGGIEYIVPDSCSKLEGEIGEKCGGRWMSLNRFWGAVRCGCR